MKTTKRILASILTMVFLLGVFALEASAFVSQDDFLDRWNLESFHVFNAYGDGYTTYQYYPPELGGEWWSICMDSGLLTEEDDFTDLDERFTALQIRWLNDPHFLRVREASEIVWEKYNKLLDEMFGFPSFSDLLLERFDRETAQGGFFGGEPDSTYSNDKDYADAWVAMYEELSIPLDALQAKYDAQVAPVLTQAENRFAAVCEEYDKIAASLPGDVQDQYWDIWSDIVAYLQDGHQTPVDIIPTDYDNDDDYIAALARFYNDLLPILEEMEALLAPVVIDSDVGVIIEAPSGVLPTGATMTANEVALSSLSTISIGQGIAVKAYDIVIKAPDGTELHAFNSPIMVTIPVPLKADGGRYTLSEAQEKLRIVHVLDSAAERVDVVSFKDLDGDGFADVAEFQATHFSIYAFVEAELKWWEKLPIWIQWLLRIFAFGWIWMKPSA